MDNKDLEIYTWAIQKIGFKNISQFIDLISIYNVLKHLAPMKQIMISIEDESNYQAGGYLFGHWLLIKYEGQCFKWECEEWSEKANNVTELCMQIFSYYHDQTEEKESIKYDG